MQTTAAATTKTTTPTPSPSPLPTTKEPERRATGKGSNLLRTTDEADMFPLLL